VLQINIRAVDESALDDTNAERARRRLERESGSPVVGSLALNTYVVGSDVCCDPQSTFVCRDERPAARLAA